MEDGDSTDPFTPTEDAYFKRDPFNLDSGTVALFGSPVSSPESHSVQDKSISISSSYSSTASSGRAALKTSSRNLSRVDGLALFTRTLEVFRLSKDLRAIEQAVRTLRDLLSTKQLTHAQLLTHGVLPPVCQLLQLHCSNASLAEECCRLLARLCERSAEARGIVLGANGVQLMQMVMETHFELYSSTVDASMRALSELCREGHVVRVLILQTRTFEWIMVCVRQWREARVLQNTALQCLERAVVHEYANRRHAVSLGVFQELLQIMHPFQDDCVLQNRCIKLCNAIIESSKEYTVLSSVEGIAGLVIRALRSFPHKLEIVASASKACQYFCCYEHSRDALMTVDGVNVLLEAFQQTVLREKDIGSSAHRKATINCLSALERVSVMESTHDRLFQIEPVHAIEWTTSQYDDDSRVGECAAMFLRTLALREMERAHSRTLFVKTKPKMLILEQVFRIGTRILSLLPENPKVAASICQMLNEGCSHGHTMVIKNSCLDLLKVIQQVVERQPSDNEVVNLAVSLAMRIN